MEIGSLEWRQLIASGTEQLGIQATPVQVGQLTIHVQELLLWNRKINLTGITLPVEVAVKHIVDSLAASKWIPSEASVLDVGSGGGFPGIPLKILFPGLSVLLIDSSRKKINFQRSIIRKLGLADIAAQQCRVEELSGKLSCRNAFSVIISRAFTSLAHFIEMSIPLLRLDGRLLAMKGRISSDELEEAETLVSRLSLTGHSYHSHVFSYNLPVLNAERYVYMLQSD